MSTTKKTKEVKAEPIRTPLANLYPNMERDTCAGREITEGVMFMQIHAGEATTTHNGKKETINIGSGLNGATVLLAHGRYFVLDVKRFLQHAIDSGLLAETLDFNRET